MTDLREQLQESLGDTYRIERELGGGGMSRVFLAEETALGRKVVLKVLPPDMAAGVSVERFRREIQLAASLQHPHIVPLHSAGSADGVFYYTMPMVQGESLRAKLARQGELPVGEAIRVLRDVTDALAHAHDHGVVHRDIKPDNVLLSGHHALVTDFGVAKAVSEATGEISITSMGVALGTPAYMAPEQATAEPTLDHRVDIYAVGILAYEMLTGRTPFQAQSAQAMLAAHVMDAPTPVTEHRASVPAALAELIMKCLEKKPADRWQSAAELHRTLEAMATPSGGTTPADTQPVKVGPPVTRNGRRYGIAAAAVVAIAAVAVFATQFGGGDDAAPVDPNVVAVLPFRVAGADPSLHYLREGMMDLLAAKFTGEGGPRAADPRTVSNAWRGAGASETEDLSQPAAIDVAGRLGAGQLLLGGIVGSPGRVVLNATLLGVPGGETRAQVTVEGPADSLPALIDRLAGSILVEGTGASARAAAALTTRSLDALRAYLAGQAAYRDGDYQVAADHYTRAVDIDSTFARAAFALRVTLGWGARGDVDRAERLAWAGRDRMSERDRALMEAYMGPDYPEFSPEADVLAARERAVTLAPDDPDAWYFLADQYFHQGQYLGYPDWTERAENGFARALALDSSFAGPVAHMVDLGAYTGDTAQVRRYGARFLASEGSDAGGYALVVRWNMAHSLRDSAMLDDVLARYDTIAQRPAYLPNLVMYTGASAQMADTMFAILARRAGSRNEREAYLVFRLINLFNRGRPAAALARADSFARLENRPVNADYMRTLSSLYWGADSAVGRAAAGRLASVATARPAATAEGRRDQYLAACALGHWRIARGRLDEAPPLIARLRNVSDDDPAVERNRAQTCAVVLEAMLATARGRPDALGLVARADSFMLTGPPDPPFHYPNLVIARLYAALGEPAAGLAAVRRGGEFGAWMTPYLREEGRLAAMTGDRAAALAAYAEVLRYWADAEPSMQDQVAAVRAEVERLSREGG